MEKPGTAARPNNCVPPAVVTLDADITAATIGFSSQTKTQIVQQTTTPDTNAIDYTRVCLRLCRPFTILYRSHHVVVVITRERFWRGCMVSSMDQHAARRRQAGEFKGQEIVGWVAVTADCVFGTQRRQRLAPASAPVAGKGSNAVSTSR